MMAIVFLSGSQTLQGRIPPGLGSLAQLLKVFPHLFMDITCRAMGDCALHSALVLMNLLVIRKQNLPVSKPASVLQWALGFGEGEVGEDAEDAEDFGPLMNQM